MAGYEPASLQKMMRLRYYYYDRSLHVKGETKQGWADKLYKQEKIITDFLTNPYNRVRTVWKKKALATMKNAPGVVRKWK